MGFCSISEQLTGTEPVKPSCLGFEKRRGGGVAVVTIFLGEIVLQNYCHYVMTFACLGWGVAWFVLSPALHVLEMFQSVWCMECCFILSFMFCSCLLHLYPPPPPSFSSLCILIFFWHTWWSNLTLDGSTFEPGYYLIATSVTETKLANGFLCKGSTSG